MTARATAEKRARQEAMHRHLVRERELAREEGRAEARREIVAQLKEMRDELTGKQGWSVKKATWTMAIMIAEGRFDKKKRKQGTLEEDGNRGSGSDSAVALGV